MALPKTLKVGGMIYSVEVVDNFGYGTPPDAIGRTEFAKEKIMVLEGMTERYTEMVLAHEVIHALLEAAGMEQNEDIVMRLEGPFYQFLKENTNLFGEQKKTDIVVPVIQLNVSDNVDAAHVSEAVGSEVRKVIEQMSGGDQA